MTIRGNPSIVLTVAYLHHSQILAEFVKTVDPKVIESVRAPHETVESVSARFLRARKYDLDAATLMMTNTSKWRATANPRQYVG